MADYRFDMLDKIKALVDEGKLDLAGYDGKLCRDLDGYDQIHYSVATSLGTPAAAYAVARAGKDFGDRGTRLIENSLMLAVEYVSVTRGRQRTSCKVTLAPLKSMARD